MEFSGGGAGVMLALAAVLWLIYLVPSWFKRREYLATERNAVRLQQSLRILAETAEVPHVVHAESTARSVAQQERIRRDQEKRRRAVERRIAAEARSRSAAAARAERAFTVPAPKAPVAAVRRPAAAPTRAPSSARAVRLRRTRLLATAMLLTGLTSVLLLAGVVATSGASLPASAGIAAGAAVGMTAVALLNRIAAVSRSLSPAVPRMWTAQEFADLAPLREEAREWTPVPLPKPLYMSKPVVEPPVMADPREDERKAAAVDAGEVTQLAPASRFAAMGRVDLGSGAAPDLEAALRRRRTAG